MLPLLTIHGGTVSSWGMQRWLLLILLASLATSCGQKREASQLETSRSKDLVALTNLAAAHNAATGWFSYAFSTEVATRHTFQLRHDLIRADSRPVLLQCQLTDVDQDQDGYMLEAKLRGILQTGIVRLRCGSNQVAVVLEATKTNSGDNLSNLTERIGLTLLQNYGIVAKITSLSRASLHLKAEASTENPEVVVDGFTAPFIAEGQCLGLVPLRNLVFNF